MIRSEDRRALSRGHPYTTIRLYLSIFGLYRVLKAPYKLKLNTITDPFSGNLRFVRQFQD